MIDRKKRLGRGHGSGRGKTSGRGSKGQKARGTVPQTSIGTMPLYKKLPLRRGFGNVSMSIKPKILTLTALAAFKAGAEVTVTSLVEAGLVDAREAKSGVKILGTGEISQKLVVKVPVSKTARGAIEKAGGSVDA